MDRALDSAPAAPGSVSLLLRLRSLGMFRVLHVACSFPRRSTAGLLLEQLGQSLAVPCQGPACSFSFLVDSTEINALTLMKQSQTAFGALRRRAAHPAEATTPSTPSRFSSSFSRFCAVAHPAALRSAGPDSPCAFPPGGGSGLQTLSLCPRTTQRCTPVLVRHLDVASSLWG